MPTITVKPGRGPQWTSKLKREITARIRRAPVGDLLVAQAKRRISNGGDSEVKYPELWAESWSGRRQHFRSGGQPLRDTGALMSSIEPFSEPVEGGARFGTQTSLKHAVYQHHGFKTAGPNFIPITLKARRNWTFLRPKMRQRRLLLRAGDSAGAKRILDELASLGLVEGETYIMAWQGVTVPARPITRFAPEDRDEIRAVVASSIAGRRS